MTLPPIPPSDNLYKFTAIGGLILVVLSLYFPLKLLWELKLMAFDLHSEVAKVDIELEYLERESKQSKKSAEFTSKNQSELQKDGGSKSRTPTNNIGRHDTKNDTEQSRSKLKQIRLRNAEMKVLGEKLKFLISKAYMVGYVSTAALAAGAWMLFYGFRNWYYRFQIYQDQIVKAQAAQWTAPKPETTERDEIPG